MTARQALADLARGGDVAVRQGVGTFVAEPKLTHDALHLLGFTEEMERVGGAVSSRVLEQDASSSPPPAIAAALDLQDGEETVRIVRLAVGGGDAAASGNELDPALALSRSGARGTGAANRCTRSWSFATDIVPARRGRPSRRQPPASSRASC